MLKSFYQWLFRLIGVREFIQEVVEQDRFEKIDAQIRRDLKALLTQANTNNPFSKESFTSFSAARITWMTKNFWLPMPSCRH